MIYINEAKYKQNPHANIGYIINEEAPDPELVADTKVVKTVNNGRRVVGCGTLQRAEHKNRNGRWYSKEELFGQLRAQRTVELLRAKELGAENGHPLTTDLQRQATIDPNNVVAYHDKLWVEGDLIKAEFYGSNLAIGEAFDQDLRDGRLPAWSLRALGSIANTNNGAEVRGVKAITWDRVIFPSHPEAYTDGLVRESAFVKDPKSGILLQTGNITKEAAMLNESGLVSPIMTQDVIECVRAESTNFNKISEMFNTLFTNIELVSEGNAVRLSNNEGTVIVCNLEKYVHSEIMNYCKSHR